MLPLSRTLLPLLFAALTSPVLAADANPPAAKKVTFGSEPVPVATLARVIQEQTGIAVDASALPADKPVSANYFQVDFWKALERFADETNSRIVTTGGKIALRPGKSHSPSHVRGPLRFTVRETSARGDLEAGTSTYDITLEVAWEPWLNTYRIDTSPKITEAKDDTGKVLSVGPAGPRTFTANHSAPLAVRPMGLTREAKKLTLKGSITVTIADELLTFEFNATGKPGPAAAQKGVVVEATKFGPDGNDWVAEVQMRYPDTGVTWESHEFYWARHNVMRLIPPKGNPIVADSVDFGEGAVRYVFKNRAKQVGAGWKFDYRTPGPMREITVPFELKDIPLP
ncbi:MAG TPA: hypothetical protein VKD90_02390 [Gemmataceae bacterium]|nr:hypothetical protein [Gemmataceae bacterium]